MTEESLEYNKEEYIEKLTIPQLTESIEKLDDIDYKTKTQRELHFKLLMELSDRLQRQKRSLNLLIETYEKLKQYATFTEKNMIDEHIKFLKQNDNKYKIFS